MIIRELPEDNQEIRNRLYQGEVFLLPPTNPSSEIVQAAKEVLHREFGDEPRKAHLRLSHAQFFEKMGRLRKEIYMEPYFHQLVRDCIEALGFSNEHTAVDPARLRIINHDGHLDPRAAAVYYPHRDIWYGHPASLITWWIPLDDLSEEETFCFYPEYFEKPVPNSSEIFDYQEWISQGWDLKIGWQNVETDHQIKYPSVIGDPPRGREVGFSCKKGQNLLFAGAQFHATRPQSFFRTRFSLDFRIVDMRDEREGIRAPRIDDRSRGTAIQDYIQPNFTSWKSVG